nr:glycosyltransferase [Pleomorphomonas sp. NRK KF1]
MAGGGAERVVLTVAGTLAERGHKVKILVVEYVVAYDVPRGVVVESLLRPGKRFSSGLLAKIGLAFRLRWHLWKMFKEHPADLHVASLPFAYEICHLARVAGTVFHVHNTLSVPLGRLALRRPQKAARQRARLVRQFRERHLVAVSRGVAQDLSREFSVPANNIDIVYNPFDLQKIMIMANGADADIPHDKFILFAGRNNSQKRIDLLIESFSMMEGDEKLVLLTETDDRLKSLISSSPRTDSIIVAGFRSNPYAWMAAAELLVLCSDWEGFGNVLVEALACGTKVVSTDCPSGPSEILIGDLSANLVPVGDAVALARRMRAVLDEPRIGVTDLSRFSVEAAATAFERLAEAASVSRCANTA